MKGSNRLLYFCFLSVLALVFRVDFCIAQLSADIANAQHQLSSTKDNFQRIDLLNKLSRLYFFKSLDSSLYYTLDAKRLAEKSGYKKGLAAAYTNYAPYYAEKGNLYLAYKFANSALDMFRSLGNKEGEFDVLLDITTFSNHEGKQEQTLAYVDQLKQINNSLHNDSVSTLMYLAAAGAYAKSGPWDEINNLLKQAIELAEKRKDSINLFEANLARGYLGSVSGGLSKDQSLQLAKPAVIWLEKWGVVFIAAIGNLNIGDIYQKAGVSDSADMYYQKALRLADSGGYLNLYRVIIGSAIHNATGKRDMDDDIVNYNILAQKNDKMLASANQNDGFSLLQATLKEKDLQIAEINAKAKQTWILFLSAMTLCLLTFLFFFYRSYKQKQKFLLAQRQLIDELELKNRVLQENNEFNKNLISIMAHDLRQPFSSIIMLDRTNAKDVMQKEQYLSIIKQMRITSEKSIQIMDGLLQWMKLQLLGRGYQASPVNLFANIEEAISFNMDAIVRKKIRIQNEINSEILINAQQEMLLFLNRNLINNAVKFSLYQGEVRISAQLIDQFVQVSIRDEGEGISPDALPHLFKNPKGSPGSAPAVKGAGIALYICMDMVQKMNGRIWAENDQVKGGAIFFYSLPLATSPHAASSLLKLDNPGSLN